MTVKSHDQTCELSCCWMCGAQDGDYDDFVGANAVLCFMEPTDRRFSCRAGYHVKCNICAIGDLQHDEPSGQPSELLIRSKCFQIEIVLFKKVVIETDDHVRDL